MLLALAFWLSLSLVYAIPENWFDENIQESASIMSEEGDYPHSYVGERSGRGGGRFDNFTVAIMLNAASYSGDNPLTAALECPRHGDASKDKVLVLEESQSVRPNSSYARYWHGYLVLLKPLLVFFNVKQIRLIFQTTVLVLLGIASIVLNRKLQGLGSAAAIMLLVTYGLFCGMDAAATLPMFFSLALALLGVIWVMRTDALSQQKILFGFGLLGALTVFFDFLDNLIVSLGIPLAVLVLRCSVDRSGLGCDERFAARVAAIVALAVAGWVVGYFYLWILKWVLATLVTGQDIILNALGQAKVYSGASEENKGSILDALVLNVQAMGIVRYVLLIVAVLAVVGVVSVCIRVLVLRKRDTGSGRQDEALRKAIPVLVALLIISLLPYAWYAAFSGHSCIHCWFTYRDQMVTMFALASCMAFGVRMSALPLIPDPHAKH